MSVNGAIVRVSRVELEWLRTHDVVDDEDDITNEWFWTDNAKSCELDKAYAAVHFLLTGQDHGGAGPLSFIANEQLGETVKYEFAYGPGRVFEPYTVSEISAALDALPSDLIESRLNDQAIREIYPFSVRLSSSAVKTPHPPLEPEDRAWIVDAFHRVRDFVRAAAEDGDFLLVAIL